MGVMGLPARKAHLRGALGSDKSADALATLYFGLCVGNALEDGEEAIFAAAYDRVSKVNTSALWGADVGGTNPFTANIATIVFPTSSGAWSIPSGGSTFDWWGIWDASTAGNLWYTGKLATPIAVLAGGATPTIAIGEVTIIQGG